MNIYFRMVFNLVFEVDDELRVSYLFKVEDMVVSNFWVANYIHFFSFFEGKKCLTIIALYTNIITSCESWDSLEL